MLSLFFLITRFSRNDVILSLIHCSLHIKSENRKNDLKSAARNRRWICERLWSITPNCKKNSGLIKNSNNAGNTQIFFHAFYVFQCSICHPGCKHFPDCIIRCKCDMFCWTFRASVNRWRIRGTGSLSEKEYYVPRPPSYQPTRNGGTSVLKEKQKAS
jgi:hypothetical protein